MKGKDDKADKLKVNLLLHCAGQEAVKEYSHLICVHRQQRERLHISHANSRNSVRMLARNVIYARLVRGLAITCH